MTCCPPTRCCGTIRGIADFFTALLEQGQPFFVKTTISSPDTSLTVGAPVEDLFVESIDACGQVVHVASGGGSGVLIPCQVHFIGVGDWREFVAPFSPGPDPEPITQGIFV